MFYPRLLGSASTLYGKLSKCHDIIYLSVIIGFSRRLYPIWHFSHNSFPYLLPLHLITTFYIVLWDGSIFNSLLLLLFFFSGSGIGVCKCKGFGDPHFTSCDGSKFNYQGKCSYLTAEPCGKKWWRNVKNRPYFKIEETHMDARNPKAQVTKSLRIYLDTTKNGKADTVNVYAGSMKILYSGEIISKLYNSYAISLSHDSLSYYSKRQSRYGMWCQWKYVFVEENRL